MKAILTVDMDGAAFEGDDAGIELSLILHKVAQHVDGLRQETIPKLAPWSLRDSNGNRVGELRIEGDEPSKSPDGYDASNGAFGRSNY